LDENILLFGIFTGDNCRLDEHNCRLSLLFDIFTGDNNERPRKNGTVNKG
jgi:hypothetical protein